MAKNDIVLLDSLVKGARSRFGTAADDGELFELFCFEQLLKDNDLSYEELESGWTDGPEDGGIDGFYVFVDGRLATDDALQFAARKNPHVHIVLFSVRRSDSFQQEPINSLLSSISELFDLRKGEEDFQYPFSQDVLAQREFFQKAFVALADRHPTLEISVYYCCRGETKTLADNLTSRAELIQDTFKSLFSDVLINVEFKGAAEILELARRQPDYSLRLRFTESYISREGRNYLVLVTLPDYYAFMIDEHDQLRRYLFESNVRDYLGEVQINQDIRRTLSRQLAPDVEDFWWLNNGVTILATHATVVGKELVLENVQIVNGLQTTETIYQYFLAGGSRTDSRTVLLKILLISDEETRARIIKATNYQNSVDLASLRGLDKIQRDIEHFLSDHNWYYDRRKNYYKNQSKPSERIVSVPYLAAAVRAVALGEPARSQQQRSRSLRDDSVYSQVFNETWDLRVYLASLEITRNVETILHGRRTVFETLPIALVHYLAYIYTCEKLGTSTYRPADVANLAQQPPTEADINRIREELRSASQGQYIQGRRYEGVALNKAFLRDFVKERYGGQGPPL